VTRNPSRQACCLLSLVALSTLTIGLASPALAARPSAAKLLPEDTVVLLSIADVPELAERFMNTSMGRMSQDAQLKPLVKHLYGSLAELVTGFQDQIGLSLPELLAIPQGELALAAVAPENGRPEVVIIVDVGDRLSGTRELIERATAALEQSGAKKSRQTVAGTRLTIYESPARPDRKAVYFEKDATVVIGSNVDVLKRMLAVWNGRRGSTLSGNRRFAAIMNRCRGTKDQKPQIRWFVDPVALMGSIGQNNSNVRLAVALLPALGLDGLAGIGGSVCLDAGEFDSVSHMHLLLDSPRAGILEMIALDSGQTTPESWVPADVASYTTLHWKFDKSYETLGMLFDGFRGEGALKAAVKQWISEPAGVDFEKKLLPALEGRVTMINVIQRPIRLTSSAVLVGLKLTDPKPVAEALETLTAKGEQFLQRQTYAGKTYWQVAMPKRLESRPDKPPMPCFGILNDYLLGANQSGIYEKVIVAAADPSNSLAGTPDFKLIAKKIRRQPGGKTPAMISFERPEEGMRFIYDLARAGNTRQALGKLGKDNPFFKSLDTALENNPLPPFAVIQQYLAPGGSMVVDDETGLHHMSFSLRGKQD